MGAVTKLARSYSVATTNQRKAQRALAYLCIDLCTEGDFWTGLTMNISEEGVFVATSTVLPLGASVGLHLELPRDDAPRIMTLGEVRWSRAYSGNDDVPPGLGIKFVGLERASVDAIRRFIISLHAPPSMSH